MRRHDNGTLVRNGGAESVITAQSLEFETPKVTERANL